MCRYGGTFYKTHMVCLPCRRSVKAHNGGAVRCPECRAGMLDAGRDFATPRRGDTRAWRALEALLRGGVTFYSCGCYGPGARPRSSAELRRARASAERRIAAQRRPWHTVLAVTTADVVKHYVTERR